MSVKKVPLLIELLVGVTLKIQLKDFFRTPCILYITIVLCSVYDYFQTNNF